MNATPTQKFYNSLEKAYSFFNATLFGSSLPDSIIVITRKKRVFGHLSYKKWVCLDNRENYCSELAINPSYIGNFPLIELFQTIVHEQSHLWQAVYGHPSQRSYHNKEWGDKMESLGLMPSSTGEPGGKRTGQYMGEYVIPGGIFEKEARELIQTFDLGWLDLVQYSSLRENGAADYSLSVENLTPDKILTCPVSLLYPEASFVESQQGSKRSESKLKYTCSCKNNIWGKPGLSITCNTCNGVFVANNNND